jgi:hypothetical protein
VRPGTGNLAGTARPRAVWDLWLRTSRGEAGILRSRAEAPPTPIDRANRRLAAPHGRTSCHPSGPTRHSRDRPPAIADRPLAALTAVIDGVAPSSCLHLPSAAPIHRHRVPHAVFRQ